MASKLEVDACEWNVASLRVKGTQYGRSSIYSLATITGNSSVDSTVISVERLFAGVIRHDPNAANGGRHMTLPAAATLIKLFPRPYYKNMSFDFCLQNTGADATESLVVAAGSGGTAKGNMTVAGAEVSATFASSGSALFRIQFTDVRDATENYNLIRLA